MTRNADGSVTFPLRPAQDAPDKPRSLILPEPDLETMAALFELFREIDDALPAVGLPDDPSKEQRDEFNAQVRERARLITVEMVYGKGIVQAIKLLTDGKIDVTTKDLYAWAANPTTAQQLLSWFQAPLHGES
jgi:hypothetical protein